MARAPKPEDNLENNIENTDKTETTEIKEKNDAFNTTQQNTEKSTAEENTGQTYIYAGPSLPDGRLKENSLFKNTNIESLKEFLKEILEKEPSVIKLIMPVKKFTEVAQKIKTPGNVLNKYYNEILSTAKPTNKETGGK